MSSPPGNELSAVKLALLAKQARARAAAQLRADPIAIVGMACRLPGSTDTPEKFWQLLCDGRDCIREVPADRWDGDAWFDPDISTSAKSLTKWGGFLDQVDGFDAAYFGILPREAQRMDPQQRVLLEVAMEALDDAGLTRDQLRGSRTSVFIASYHNDYANLQYQDLEAVDARTLTGILHSVLANRLSYILDLRGPNLSLDTACSSSLVATHLACQSLRFGESDIAIAGGVSLMLTPDLMVSLSKVGFMAPDGRCKTFDVTANGFGRGEGCGVIVMKRLSDAIADGDRVLAVVRGSVVNQDGHSTLLAAPNGLAQQAMIREALANAQLQPERIGYIETHGTGTALGDPIEVEAIAATLGQSDVAGGACYLGAVKANLGHLEAAAGVTGLIKSVLVLRHAAIPPQVHFTQLSPHISFRGTRLAIAKTLTPWPAGAAPRCAGVSSFGVGGTNAHVILEEAPVLDDAPPEDDGAARLLPLSAHSPAALRELAQRWIAYLGTTDAHVGDLGYSASERRTHYEQRLAVLGRSPREWSERLQEYLRDTTAPEAAPAPRTTPRRVAFVFSGQGPQWYAMGRELLAQETVFREVMQQCDALLGACAGWSLLQELTADESASRLEQTEVAQPALFAIQVALAALWKSWGIVPQGVVGHSIGEIAALHVAGVLTLPDAIRVVWQRGLIMQRATGLGHMAAVALTEAEADALLRPYGERLSVAAINAPRSVVLSGETAALDDVLAQLATRGVTHRLLPVQYAFHSAQMQPFRQELVDALSALPSQPPALPLYSTVTGALAMGQRFDAEYFGRNVREPVRLASALHAMAADGFDAFVEIAPHPVLAGAINECLTESLGEQVEQVVVTGSLRRGRPERDTMLQAAAALYSAGLTLDWPALQSPGRVVSLPRYPWQRKRYWIRERPAASRGTDSGHAVLGRRLATAGSRTHIFEGSAEAIGHWLVDHRIFGRLVLPAAAVLDAFNAAARSAYGGGSVVLNDFVMRRPVFVTEGELSKARWQVHLTQTDGRTSDLEMYEACTTPTSAAPTWRLVASARAAASSESDSLQLGSSAARTWNSLLDCTSAESLSAVSSEAIYARFAALGVEFGPHLRCLQDIRRGDGVAQAWVQLPPDLDSSTYALHPVLLDAALQLCSLAVEPDAGRALPAAVVLPLGADHAQFLSPAPARLLARAQVRIGTGGSLSADVTLESAGGSPFACIQGMKFAPASAAAFDSAEPADEWIYDVAWRRAPLTAASSAAAPAIAPHRWLILADRSGVGKELASSLRSTGASCLLVFSGDHYAQIDAQQWVVNPTDPAHFQRLLTEIGAGSLGVVHLWSLDTAAIARLDSQSLQDGDALVCASLLHLVQSLSAAPIGASTTLWLISRGAVVVTGEEPVDQLRLNGAQLWGLAPVIALEHPELQVRVLDMDPSAVAQPAEDVLRELRAMDPACRRVVLRSGTRWLPQIERYQSPPSGAVAKPPQSLRLIRPGTLDGVDWVPTARGALPPDQVRLHVLAAGINFRDVLLTLGMYAAASIPLGAECVGLVVECGADVHEFRPGERVFGFAPGSFATEVCVPAAFLAPVPATLSDEEAAGIPVAYLTAYYGLHTLARLQAGERVLIHAAAGGVGLAAVQLAVRAGAIVFATAGTAEKRAALMAMGVARAMDSRSLDFVAQIRAATQGQGVHVALNSLAGEFIPATMSVLAPGGRFLELGKRDTLTVASAAQLRADVRYHLYDLGTEAQADLTLLRPMFAAIIAALADGSLRALPVKTFPRQEVREALRFMAQARHMGKLVLRFAPAEGETITSGSGNVGATGVATRAENSPSGNLRATRVSSEATYLITGGLGGVGMHTARWLVEAGARHLVLTARRPPSAGNVADIRELEARGARIVVRQTDAGDAAQMQALFATIECTMPPLRGVVHAAGQLHDGVLMNQHWSDCADVLTGKAHGAWIVHELTRGLALDFFVMYSAAGVLLGAAGQGAYPAANAQLDLLAHVRHQLGLPALSIAWGAWAGSGMAAGVAQSGSDAWQARGIGQIDASGGFARLERLLDDGIAYAAVMPIQWPRFLEQLPAAADRSMFRALTTASTSTSAPVATPGPQWLDRLSALPAGQRRAALLQHLAEKSRQVIGLEEMNLDTHTPLKEMGLDSLMAVELRNSLVRSTGRPLPATLLFDYPTLDALAGFLMQAMSLDPKPQPIATARAASEVATVPTDIAALSDDEAEALLLAELAASAGKSS